MITNHKLKEDKPCGNFYVGCFASLKMKRSLTAASGATQVTTTTVTKKQKIPKSLGRFGAPAWAGKTKSGFPKQLRMSHRYCDVYPLTSTAGSQPQGSFSCNGMYDPDISGTGHQPMYFDQLAAIYNHYTVVKSTIVVRLRSRGSSAGAIYAIYINDDSTVTPTNVVFRCEQSSAVYKTVGYQQSEEVVIKKTWDAKKNFGPGALADPNLQGTASANPTEQQMFTLTMSPLDGATACTVDAFVTITYDAIWQELKDIAAS